MVLEILRDLGVLTIGAALLYFLGKHLIRNYFQKELEGYRSKLEEERIKFTELHGTRAEVIAELYEKLVDTEEAMELLASPIEFTEDASKEDRMVEAQQQMSELYRYYNRKKIYLPQEVAAGVDELFDEYDSIFRDFSILRIHDRDYWRDSDKVIENMNKWVEDWQSVSSGEVNQIKEDLEDNFREMLGVRTNEASGLEDG